MSTGFTVLVLAGCVVAAVNAWSWPVAAKLVPLTACGIAIVATALNLIAELFGAKPAANTVAVMPAAAMSAADVEKISSSEFGEVALLDLPVGLLRRRAGLFFLWLGLFAAAIAVVGFIPAIAVFIFAYMAWGFREAYPISAVCAAVMAVACFVVFDLGLKVAWPQSLLGDLFPAARDWFDFL
jgi:hypothetical protein